MDISQFSERNLHGIQIACSGLLKPRCCGQNRRQIHVVWLFKVTLSAVMDWLPALSVAVMVMVIGFVVSWGTVRYANGPKLVVYVLLDGDIATSVALPPTDHDAVTVPTPDSVSVTSMLIVAARGVLAGHSAKAWSSSHIDAGLAVA